MADDFTIAQFRQDFPEFSDGAVYTDASITFWANVADSLLNANRWGDLLLFGTELFVAHNIVLEEIDKTAADNAGGIPGMDSGVISSKSAGSVSVSMDTQASIENEGGNYNLTTYGTRFLRLARLKGIGGLQIY